MYCLVYTSRAQYPFDELSLENLLLTARRNNKTLGITGCLLYHEGSFVQYLEGNQVKVLQLFDKIKADQGHTTIRLLSYNRRKSREFKDWDMAYYQPEGQNDLINYLKLLASTKEDLPDFMKSSPTSHLFWSNVSSMLPRGPI